MMRSREVMFVQPELRILYVEDEPHIREITKLALEMLGNFQVEVAGSGAEALARLRDLAPDMILLDVMMPGLDGPGTLVALRQVPGMQSVPVAFMTAMLQPEEISRLQALGARGVIAKPFDPMTLADQVRALFGEAKV